MLKYLNVLNFAVCSTRTSIISELFGQCSINGCLSRPMHSSYLLNKRPGIVYPNGYSFDWAWKAVIPNIGIYTHEPLPHVKTGGRGPDGRLAIKHIGGGLKRPHFMVSPFRGGLSNGSELLIKEKILYIHKNWWRPEFIALVAKDLQKRWIYATSTMKVGDIIMSHGNTKQIIKNPKPGDACMISCLDTGTAICQIERYPGKGAHYAIKAGTQGFIHQKLNDNTCIIKMGKRLLKISCGCSVVVGQMSNPDHNKMRFTKFGQKRWLGIRQRSGLFQRKTGRFGRKLRNPRTVNFTKTEDENKVVSLRYTRDDKPKAIKKKGTFEKPVHLKPIPLEVDEIHPTFKWCSWSNVR